MPPRSRPRPNLGGLAIKTKQPRFETLRPERLAASIDAGSGGGGAVRLPLILDVRGSDFEGGHIAGATREAFDGFDDRRADELLREMGLVGPPAAAAAAGGAAAAADASSAAAGGGDGGGGGGGSESACVMFYCMYSQQRAPSCATRLLHRAIALGVEVVQADTKENIFTVAAAGATPAAAVAAAAAPTATATAAPAAAAPARRTLRVCVLAGGYNLWVNTFHAHASRDVYIEGYDSACWVASRDINTTVGGVPGGICLIHILEVPIAQLAEANISEDTGPQDITAVAPAKTS